MKTVGDLTNSLVDKLKKSEYVSSGDSSYKHTVLSEYSRAELISASHAISEWIRDNFSDNMLETESLKQRISFLEEMVKKSNFAPMIDDTPKGEELIELLLNRMKDEVVLIGCSFDG